VSPAVKKKSFIGRIFSFPKRKKEKSALDNSLQSMDSRQSVGIVCERDSEERERDRGEVEREKVGERLGMEDSEGYQENKVEDAHVHVDIAEIFQDKEDEHADAEPRHLSEGEERRGLQGASEGREDQEKRRTHEEAQREQGCSVVLEEKPSEGKEEVVVGKDVREDVMYEILAEIKKLNTRMKAIEEARN
jgi:hypothetical protein